MTHRKLDPEQREARRERRAAKREAAEAAREDREDQRSWRQRCIAAAETAKKALRKASIADPLASIADLVRGGMPVPISIVPARDGQPTRVQLYDEDDLAAWMTLLEVVAPMWVDGHAEWPEGEFDGHPFALACYRGPETVATAIANADRMKCDRCDKAMIGGAIGGGLPPEQWCADHQPNGVGS